MHKLSKLEDPVVEELRSNFNIYNQGQAIEELVLNSVDANATMIEVFADTQNFAFEVRDNGDGMAVEDLELIGQRHATSKLKSLYDQITSNGFRGEAVASVGTIAFLEITTRTKSSHTVYSKLIQGGSVISFGPATSGPALNKPHGTNILVRDLFFKLPVRKKILLASNEIEDIKQRMESIALAHPDVSFSLYDRARGTKLLQSKSGQSLLSCFAHLFGVQRVEGLSEIKGSSTSPWKLKISGFASSPYSAGHHSKALQFLFVNRRKVKHTPIHSLLQKLYAVHMDKSPIFVLFLECSSLLYDVLYDPDKTTIQFIDWDPVLSLVEKTFSFLATPKSGLKGAGKIPTYSAKDVANLNKKPAPNKIVAMTDDDVDDDDSSPSCSPAILTLHTITPKSSSTFTSTTTTSTTSTTSSSSSSLSSSPPSSSPTDASAKPPAPIAVSATHEPRPRTHTRERSRSAPPFYKRAQFSVHNNPLQSTKSGSPTKPACKSPQTVVIAPPPVTLLDFSKQNSSDKNDKHLHNNVNNNNNITVNKIINKSNTYKNTTPNNNNTNNNKNKNTKDDTDSDSTESEPDNEFRAFSFGPQSSDESASQKSKKSKKSELGEKGKGKNTGKQAHKNHNGHHCAHSDDEDHHKRKSRPDPEDSDTSSEGEKASGGKSDDYDDPEPPKKKKFKKGKPKWDHKRKFDIPDYGDDDAQPDSYAAKVKQGLDEVYRIPQDEMQLDTAITRDTVHQMTVVGQADKKFVITRVNNVLYVVDQHAADERVRLERLEAAVGTSNAVSTHILNKPQRWVLAPHEIRTAKLRKTQLENWGFRWEYSPVDEHTLIVNQVPTLFDTRLSIHDFREFIAQLEESRGSSLTRPNAIGRILNSKACRGAVMFGDPLSQEECGVLIGQVVKCKLPFQCAHGRPSMHPLLDLTKVPIPNPTPKRRKGLPNLPLSPPSSSS